MSKSYPTSGPVKILTNLADSALANPLKTGQIKTELAQFEFVGPKVAHDGFKPMIRENAYDAGELAIVTFLQAKAYGKPYVLLPAAMVGRFQHQTIGYNTEVYGETLNPKDLEGKRVGIRAYTQTTGVWARGLLKNDYDVDIDKVTWVCQDDSHVAEYVEPPNVERTPPGSKKIPELLLEGDIGAAILGNDMPKDPKIKLLIPDFEKAGKEWYAKNHAVHVNHLFVVHSDLSKQRPDVVKEIYRALQESKAASGVKPEIDTLPFGYDNLYSSLELAIKYAYQQKLIPHMLTVDELFDDTTRSLGR